MPHAPRIVDLVLLGAVAASGCRGAPQPLRTEPDGGSEAPVATVSAAPSPPVSPASARPSVAPAERCFTDAGCSDAGATRPEADDGKESETSCFRAYYGIGELANPARARACFEHVVRREKEPAGGSPSLSRTFLGLMLLDGQGGARERERGDGLFVNTLNDSGVRRAALEREQSGAAKPIDFCADIGGTTRDMYECAEIDLDREQIGALEAEKEILAKLALDEAGLALWSKAKSAWDQFSWKDVRYMGDFSRGGSVRIVQETWVAAARTRERIELLFALLDANSAQEDTGELKQAEASALAAARDVENRKLLANAQAAWKAYRTAEMDFGRRAFAKAYGSEDAAARAVGAEVTKRRAKRLRDAVKER